MKYLVTERRGGVLDITINHPKANAINVAVSRELADAFTMLQHDSTLVVATLTGTGRFFSAGFDLKAAANNTLSEDDDFGSGGFAGLTEFFDLDKPVVAAVNGIAVGGGLELALACDIIVASEDAEFWLPEAKLGNVPDAGGLQRLPKAIPRAVAMDMLLTGRRMGAAEALHYGLVSRVAAAADLLLTARLIAEQLAQSAPLSLTTIKQATRVMESLGVRESFVALRDGRVPNHAAMMRSADHAEGPLAFYEGRAPKFVGR